MAESGRARGLRLVESDRICWRMGVEDRMAGTVFLEQEVAVGIGRADGLKVWAVRGGISVGRALLRHLS